MKCFKCGEEINDAMFCPYCGADNRAQREKETLALLVRDTQNGDQTAANDLLSYAYPFMFNTARCIAKNDSDAQDITQEASIKILKSIGSLNSPNTFKSWANTIVRNTAIDLLGKASNIHDIHFTDLDNPDDGLSYDPADERITSRPDIQMSDNARKEIVLEVLDSLKEEQRVIAMMYFYQGMSYKEIAEELHIKESTVTGRLNTAKKNIRASVETIQKRDDIKLYNLSPVAWFIWLLRGWRDSAEERGSQVLHKASQRYSASSQAVQSTAGKAVTSSVSHQTAQTVSTAASAAAVTAASAAGMSAAAKAGIAAAVVAIGGAAIFGVSKIMKKPDQTPEPVAETAPEETPEPLAAVWVHEPDMRLDLVEEMRESPVYNDVEVYGYPQKWDPGRAYDYTADAIIAEKDNLWGIYDYSGNELYLPSISSGSLGTSDNCPISFLPGTDISNNAANDPSYETCAFIFPASDSLEPYCNYFDASFTTATQRPYYGFDGDGAEMSTAVYEGNLVSYNPFDGTMSPIHNYNSKDDLRTIVDVIDASGNQIGSAVVSHYGSLEYTYPYSVFNFVNGYFVLDESGKYYNSYSEKLRIYDGNTGKPLNDQYYDKIKFFENGYCPVRKNGKWGFIDIEGNEVTDFIWDDVSTLYEGKAYVGTGGIYGILDLPASLANTEKLTAGNVYGDTIPSAEDWVNPRPPAIGTLVTKVTLNARSGPGTEYESSFEINPGYESAVYEIRENDGYTWYRTEYYWFADQNGEWVEYTPY